MINLVKMFFLFLANTIILVHSFIPHYDTTNGVHCCTAEHHFQTESLQDFHLSGLLFPAETKENHGGISFENCLLDRIYVRFDKDNPTLQSSDSEIGFLLVYQFLSSDYTELASPVSDIFSSLQKPYINTSYTNEIARSSGLRAPPFC
jgi:hypothetical protein